MQFVMGVGRVVIPLLAAFVSSIFTAAAGMLIPGIGVLAGGIIGLIVLFEKK